MTRALPLLLLLMCVGAPGSQAALAPTDEYLAGYAAAILERELDLPAAAVRVERGIVSVDGAKIGDVDPEMIRARLTAIPGVAGVRIVAADAAVPAEEPTPPTPSARRKAATRTTGFLPPGELFRPLLADPRWPRFSATYRYYQDDTDEIQDVGSANFGATVPIYRDHVTFGPDGWWETGLQAGVFSIFDLGAASKDLVNADYFVAIMGAHQTGKLSTILRLLHQSSHLGDEFLLRNRTDRVNLSYEAVDLKLAYDLIDALRVYAGGAYLFDQEPADLDAGWVQYGAEVTSPWTLAGGAATPVVALDIQHTEENAWSAQFSLVGGVRLEKIRIADTAIFLGLEWYRGFSPNGQFYGRRVEWVGIGAHLFL